MRIWGIHKKYNSLSWAENFLGGHISIGKLTVFGENAMHWAVSFHSKKYGYICFRLPFRCFGRWFPLYFYLSPNGTPWASTFYKGPSKEEVWRSKIRRELLGHNFNTLKNDYALSAINNYHSMQEYIQKTNTKKVLIEKECLIKET